VEVPPNPGTNVPLMRRLPVAPAKSPVPPKIVCTSARALSPVVRKEASFWIAIVPRWPVRFASSTTVSPVTNTTPVSATFAEGVIVAAVKMASPWMDPNIRAMVQRFAGDAQPSVSGSSLR
jgi:hypothetical protein